MPEVQSRPPPTSSSVKPSAASQRESIHGRCIELVSRMTSVESPVRVCTWLSFHHEQYRDHDELPYHILNRFQYNDIWNWAFMIISGFVSEASRLMHHWSVLVIFLCCAGYILILTLLKPRLWSSYVCVECLGSRAHVIEVSVPITIDHHHHIL